MWGIVTTFANHKQTEMGTITTRIFKPFSINLKGRLVEAKHPVVMGIINATPDSFYSGSRTGIDADATSRRAERMVADGADWLDIGAYSSRPGATDISPEEELSRLHLAVKAVRNAVGNDIPLSIDTFRAYVAREAICSMGADIINDIAGGDLDENMFSTVAELRVPYILMHMRGTPATMQSLTDYPDGVVAGVITELQHKVRRLALLGVCDVIVDPGFGFAKNLRQNYQLMESLSVVAEALDRPLLVGVSRKSMATKLLGINADEALNATTALHTAALLQGASILRVHDVREAVQAVKIVDQLTYCND